MGENTETIFTDMLGTSLGIVERGNTYVAIDKTSFGNPISESISDASNTFYTGKPYIDGLGYAFLFRNYCPDLGKWPSQDPIGYPDGWNNFAYCNNIVTITYDLLGGVLNYTSGSSVANAISILKAGSPTMNRIITVLENSEHIHNIAHDSAATGKGSYVSGDTSYTYQNVPTGSDVHLDGLCDNNTSPFPGDPNGWNRPLELGIAHELIHSYQYDQGTYDPNMTGGIENSEIEACRETNRALKELQQYDPALYDVFEPRKNYGGNPLPENAVNPE